MCGPRNAASPDAEAERVLEERPAGRAPAARTARRTAIGRGTYPRDAPEDDGAAGDHPRRPSRRTASRSRGRGRRNRSAMPPRRSSASSLRYAIGSSDRLPDVMTSGPAGVGEQQVMERRVGQQQADQSDCAARLPPPGRSRVAGGARTIGRSTDCEQPRVPRRRVPRSRPAAAQVRHHHGEEASRHAACARAARATAAERRRVAGQVEPAEPLDARQSGRPRSAWAARRIGSPPASTRARRAERRQSRAAHRAGVRLRVKAAIRGDRRTPRGTTRTSRKAPSSSPRGRTARRARS